MKTLPQIFDQVLEATDQKSYSPTGTPTFKIKPSSLGSPCIRKIYYSSAGVPEDYGFPLDGKRRMKLGDAIHAMLHEVFLKAGILIDYYNPDGSVPKDWKGNDDLEFPLVSPDLFIKKGKIDAVMVIDGKLWIGEYKSINSKGFSELMQPKAEHVVQAVTYLYVFNQHLADGKFSHIKELQGFEKAEGVRFLYVCKDDTNLKEYVLTNTDYIFQQIVEKIMLVRHHYDNKILPEKTQDWCRSCNFRDKCKINYNIK